MSAIIDACDEDHDGQVTLAEWMDATKKMQDTLDSLTPEQRETALEMERAEMQAAATSQSKTSQMAPVLAETNSNPLNDNNGIIGGFIKQAGGSLANRLATSFGLSNHDAKGIENLFATGGEQTRLDSTAITAVVTAAVIETEAHMLTALQVSHKKRTL
eukprot:gnl/TRDRNA2_/TRDRNA2_162739_c0_seq2.p1 gnl/TRDRNA2_/TRDRNA2_162739_c0~~gnl/TRDRNA2_/TRDRNA2_162739_c0_seq2.p1  ORF type:complete len:181 (-),score=38.82 gnl/TRDRNA2_/TRDRNA2_162739_c0_seq2:281-757(-)